MPRNMTLPILLCALTASLAASAGEQAQAPQTKVNEAIDHVISKFKDRDDGKLDLVGLPDSDIRTIENSLEQLQADPAVKFKNKDAFVLFKDDGIRSYYVILGLKDKKLRFAAVEVGINLE